MKPTMKSYTIQVQGGSTVLASREAPLPVAGAGQVLVRLHATSLNRGEFIAAHGLYATGGAPKPAGVRAFVSDLLHLFADGRLRPVVDRIYPFEELPEAKAYMESNAHLGKIVVRAG